MRRTSRCVASGPERARLDLDDRLTPTLRETVDLLQRIEVAGRQLGMSFDELARAFDNLGRAVGATFLVTALGEPTIEPTVEKKTTRAIIIRD